MQIVIEISEANYEYFKNTHFIADEKIVFKQSPEDIKGTMNLFRLVDAVKDGIVLPKGHGRLIDESLMNDDNVFSIWEDDGTFYRNETSLPTVIPADEEGEN